MNENVGAGIVCSDPVGIKPSYKVSDSGCGLNTKAGDEPFWNCEQLNTASVNGLPPLTFSAGARVSQISDGSHSLDEKLTVGARYSSGSTNRARRIRIRSGSRAVRNT